MLLVADREKNNPSPRGLSLAPFRHGQDTQTTLRFLHGERRTAPGDQGARTQEWIQTIRGQENTRRVEEQLQGNPIHGPHVRRIITRGRGQHPDEWEEINRIRLQDARVPPQGGHAHALPNPNGPLQLPLTPKRIRDGGLRLPIILPPRQGQRKRRRAIPHGPRTNQNRPETRRKSIQGRDEMFGT